MGSKNVITSKKVYFCDVCNADKPVDRLIKCNICGNDFCIRYGDKDGCGIELYTFPKEIFIKIKNIASTEEIADIVHQSEVIGGFVCDSCTSSNAALKNILEQFKHDCKEYESTHDMTILENILKLNAMERAFILSLSK